MILLWWLNSVTICGRIFTENPFSLCTSKIQQDQIRFFSSYRELHCPEFVADRVHKYEFILSLLIFSFTLFSYFYFISRFVFELIKFDTEMLCFTLYTKLPSEAHALPTFSKPNVLLIKFKFRARILNRY